jgi:3-oxoacyl-[acyl-carrier-protein] synthase-1
MQPVTVRHYTAVCAAGRGRSALWDSVVAGRSGLAANDLPGITLNTHIGRVAGLEDAPLPADFAEWDCRNNRLALLALQQDGLEEAVVAVRERFGPRRIAVVLGTSTGSIGSTEDAYRARVNDVELPVAFRRPVVHSPYSLVDFVRRYLELEGPAFGISTACSSSARVFGSAERLLRLGLADAVLVGGTDSLCQSVLYGFNSLELMSPDACRPFDVARQGLSLGEGSGYALLERGPGDGIVLRGYGETSDAHHMSSPHPEGLGARRAMEQALASAGLEPAAIDYVNLHGTATRLNDQVEGEAMRALFRDPVACSSVKGWTGHTLGAAGIVEAVYSLLSLEHGLVPQTLNCTEVEPRFRDYVRTAPCREDLHTVMTNSFGFGGNNCSLIFGTAP